ncbi:hypothetical protein JXA12_00710 [Candidatus Woesearchaeota archaeon]|nr:hypothetical protein [Candidatus Woesearchaeota archaeon]
METNKERQKLEEKRIDLEIRQGKDALYIRILISFGTISILIATIMLLMFETRMMNKSFAMLIIGVFLLFTGMLWQHKDEKQLDNVSEDLQHYKDRELSSYRK